MQLSGIVLGSHPMLWGVTVELPVLLDGVGLATVPEKKEGV